MNLNFNIDGIKTFEDVRDALQRVRDAFKEIVLAKGDWKFVEISLDSAVTRLTYSHKLSFTPKDLIQVSVSNGAVVTWHYDDFDRTNILLSSTAACIVRAYIGRYKETP